MAYDTQLADRIREHLLQFPGLHMEEKKMFRGLTFMINGKMCISVSGENLMCRFDPEQHGRIAQKKGFLPMIMKGREYKGYGYITPNGCRSESDLAYWANLCLQYNEQAKASKNRKTGKKSRR